MRRTHVLAALAMSLLATALPAVSTSAATPSRGHRPSAVGREAAADRALSRADAALNGDGARHDVTLALRDLAQALPSLGLAERRRARAMLARPTSRHDRYGDSYRAPSKRICSATLCVHWVSRTSDAPPSRAWVRRTKRVLQHTWSREVGGLGYRRPVRDGRRGGDGRLDVYLKDVGAKGYFGYCAPERRTRASKWQASGYCVLDDDFARSQFGQQPIRSLKATAAHEFFHEVQFAYDFAEDAWFMETTATWMEERVFDGVNDNRRYLRYGQLRYPQRPLDIFENLGAAQYANWVFFEYLSHRFDNGIVRSAWEEAAARGDKRGRFSIQAIKAALPAEVTFPDLFARYTASNTVPSVGFPRGVYPEGGQWPAAPATRRYVLDGATPVPDKLRIDHLASKNLDVVPGSGLGPGALLTVSVHGPASGADPVASVVVRHADGSVTLRQIDLATTSTVTVAFDQRATVTLGNASTVFQCRQGTAYSCQGTGTDDQRFTFTLEAQPG